MTLKSIPQYENIEERENAQALSENVFTELYEENYLKKWISTLSRKDRDKLFSWLVDKYSQTNLDSTDKLAYMISAASIKPWENVSYITEIIVALLGNIRLKKSQLEFLNSLWKNQLERDIIMKPLVFKYLRQNLKVIDKNWNQESDKDFYQELLLTAKRFWISKETWFQRFVPDMNRLLKERKKIRIKAVFKKKLLPKVKKIRIKPISKKKLSQEGKKERLFQDIVRDKEAWEGEILDIDWLKELFKSFNERLDHIEYYIKTQYWLNKLPWINQTSDDLQLKAFYNLRLDLLKLNTSLDEKWLDQINKNKDNFNFDLIKLEIDLWIIDSLGSTQWDYRDYYRMLAHRKKMWNKIKNR